MILFFVLRTYFQDVKEIGKERLAVPLGERLLCYFGMVGLPTIYLIGCVIYTVIRLKG